jgi:hypothetical protein
MMKLIFERETAIGQCDADRIYGHFGDAPGEWIAFALTTATMTGTKGMLRIQQSCFLRSAHSLDDIRAQSWVRPEMTLEPILACQEETKRLVRQLHEQFVQKARNEFVAQSIVSSVIPVGDLGES